MVGGHVDGGWGGPNGAAGGLRLGPNLWQSIIVLCVPHGNTPRLNHICGLGILIEIVGDEEC